jgi:F0F1-type ATP synthase assembly protein I
MAALGNWEKNGKENNGQAPRLSSGQAAWWQPAIIMFLKLSVWIAAPVIIALYFGKWLDKKFNTAPWLFLFCMGAAFLISMVGLIKNTLAEYKKIEQTGQAEKEEKN